ncbi:MAG: hypothetical protein E5V94_12405, partial [Mesorhizobium sp.]
MGELGDLTTGKIAPGRRAKARQAINKGNQQKGNAMTNDNPIHSSVPAGISRRYFLQVTAAGVVTTT